jgi:prlF antitoxin for toxin YhaV_toxin
LSSIQLLLFIITFDAYANNAFALPFAYHHSFCRSMSVVRKVESTLPDRYQTTALDGSEKYDPVTGAFLDFLAHDITAHPERLATMQPALAKRMKKLTAGVKFNLTEALDSVTT